MAVAIAKPQASELVIHSKLQIQAGVQDFLPFELPASA